MTACEVLLLLLLGFPLLVGGAPIPRNSVPHQDGGITLFRDEGIYNYTTFLLREDLGVLFLGARDAIYALDMNNISRKMAELQWSVPLGKRILCSQKGKNFETDCRNYIRVLQRADDDRMYVCGTNAFSPTCTYMTYSDGQLNLEVKQDRGKGKSPFDPYQRHASVILDGDMYSATSSNFMGYDLALMRTPLRTLSTKPTLRTYESMHIFNDPEFVHMDVVRESEGSTNGDEDKVYMFFTENAVEFDYPDKLRLSRIARVAKGDVGGHRMLSKRWTTFLKARLDCRSREPGLPYIIQNVFLLEQSDWRDGIFYAVFNAQDSSDQSAVCAYSVSAIQDLFTKGRYKMPIRGTSPVKWTTYYGEIPEPRPGAGINAAARALGVESSLHLPDKTLQFVRDRPLMDEAVQPLGGGPRLLKKGPKFTSIAVDRVMALDGRTYDIMFIGTENGVIQKAVNFDGEMYIIEVHQLLPVQEPIKTLHLSHATGQLYAGSETAAAQLPVQQCGRLGNCQDCVRLRDPHCAWDVSASFCTALSGRNSTLDRNLIQSLRDADTTMCPGLEALPTEVPPTEALPTKVLPTEVPPTEALPTKVPPTEALPTKVPPTEAPSREMPKKDLPCELPPTDAPLENVQLSKERGALILLAVLSVSLILLVLCKNRHCHLPSAGCCYRQKDCPPTAPPIQIVPPEDEFIVSISE